MEDLPPDPAAQKAAAPSAPEFHGPEEAPIVEPQQSLGLQHAEWNQRNDYLLQLQYPYVILIWHIVDYCCTM